MRTPGWSELRTHATTHKNWKSTLGYFLPKLVGWKPQQQSYRLIRSHISSRPEKNVLLLHFFPTQMPTNRDTSEPISIKDEKRTIRPTSTSPRPRSQLRTFRPSKLLSNPPSYENWISIVGFLLPKVPRSKPKRRPFDWNSSLTISYDLTYRVVTRSYMFPYCIFPSVEAQTDRDPSGKENALTETTRRCCHATRN